MDNLLLVRDSIFREAALREVLTNNKYPVRNIEERVSILSERRVYAPYGIKGGEPGTQGLNLYKKADGEIKVLRHREVLKVGKEDSIIIETPGGGGYGKIK